MLVREREIVASGPTEREEFTKRLMEALGNKPIHELYTPHIFDQDTEEDMYMRGDAIAVAVASSWQADSPGYNPSHDIMFDSLAHHAVRWSLELEERMPSDLAPIIQTGMVHLAIQILAKTEAADGTRYAAMRDRNLMRRRFQELWKNTSPR